MVADRTSVSMAKVGFHPSGGMILAIPYLAPSGAILRMYSMGSLNSSSVGLKVGASGMLCKRFLLLISGAAFFCPLRSTVDRSRGAERRALSGIGTLLLCVVGATEPDVGAADFPLDDAVLMVGVFDAARLAAAAAAAGPPLLGGTTIANTVCAQLGHT